MRQLYAGYHCEWMKQISEWEYDNIWNMVMECHLILGVDAYRRLHLDRPGRLPRVLQQTQQHQQRQRPVTGTRP